MSPDRPIRVLLVASHPIQYFAPLFHRYAADPALDVTVAYCSMESVEGGLDPEFGTRVAWDVPLLDGYRWIAVPNRSPRPALASFRGQMNPGLWRMVRDGAYDAVVVFGYRTSSAWIAISAARSLNIPYAIVTDAQTLAGRPARSWGGPLKRAIVPRIYRAADGVLSMSTPSTRFIASLGVPAERIHLLPYVVDNDFFAERAAAVDREEVRVRLGVPSGALLAIYCGKLVPWKRVGDLVAALAQAPEVHLACVGEGSLRSGLQKEAKRLGVGDRLHFTGFANQTELPALYAAADVLCLVSDYEPFGLVVNEAFATGLPAVVSSSCGCVGDLVIDGETGFVVDPGAVPAIAERLRRLAANPGLRRRLGAAARERMAAWGPPRNAEAFRNAVVVLSSTRPAR
jgi:glycosyltransferase involved in cell wall biosynthesis